MSLTEAEELAIFGRFPDVGLPIVLLPVRVETRFMRDSGELWVRIYPDEIHVDTHEPELTDDEATWGRHFWEQTWRAGRGDDPASVERRHRIWEQLAQRFDAERATWIVEALTPTNPGDRPGGPTADDSALPSPPTHPDPGSRAGSWTRAPVARLLPERFVVLGHRGGARVMRRAGSPVRPNLHVGLDPSAPPPEVAPHDAVTVDEGMRWLVDFKAAEKIGMAIRVPLTADDMTFGFDVLLVTGLRTAPAPDDEADAIEALIAAHRYTEGCAVATVGTATNNTDRAPSGHAARQLDPTGTYPLDRPDVAADSAAARLATALGIDVRTVGAVPGSESRHDIAAAAMQTLLWPATGGYFLDHLFSVLTDAPSARAYTLANVRAEGPLPLLRVGRQPYGVLPVSSLDRWPVLPPGSGPSGFPRPNVVIPLLKGLRDRWRSVTARVPRIDRRAGGPAATESRILAVLRSAPTSAAYDMRLVFDDALFGVAGLHSRSQLPPQATQRTASTQALLRGLGILGDPRLLHTVLTATSAPLGTDAMVARADAPQGDPELLAWLRDSAPDVIVAEEGLDARPGHLLYLIARHAVLLAYASVATDIQRAGGDAEPAAEPAVVDVTEPATVTVGRRIARPLPGITKPLHALTAADHPAAARLDDMRAALDHLATLGPERLTTLLTGTLDVFAYRLDAWLTSLATRRLAELRAATPGGAVVGAFGWLEDVRPRAPLAAVPALPKEPGPLVVDPVSAGFVHAPSLPHAATAALLRAGYVAAGPARADQSVRSPFAVDLSSRRVRLAGWLLDGVRQGQELGALLGQRFERGLHDRGLDRYIAPFRRVAPFGELATAQAKAADAADHLADVRAKSLDRPAALAELSAAQAAHAALVQEQAGLPSRVARARAALASLPAEIADVDSEIETLQEELRNAGTGKPAIIKMINAARQRRAQLSREAGPRQAAIDAAVQRQTVIGGLVADALTRFTTAEKRLAIAEAADRDLPEAIEHDAGAKAELERVLAEHRRRRLYPPTATIESLEAVESVHLVDGLALARLHEKGSVPFGTKGLPPAKTSDHASLLVELGRLDAALDAVADALTAESVHQVVQGNPQRAGASLDSVANRNVAPPDLEIARTPRTGVAITHRVLTIVPEPGEGWPLDARQVRAIAEPALERWAAAVLGDPHQIRCDVRWIDAAGELIVTRDLRMATTGLGALDVLAMVDGSGAPRPELTAYLSERALTTRPADVPDGSGVDLVLDRDPDWPAEVRSFGEVFEVARAVNELLATARPVAPGDLAPAGSRSGTLDLVDLAGRADALERRVGVAHDALVGAVDGEDPAALRSAMVQMLYLGVPGSVPTAPVGDGAASLDELRSRGAGIAADVGRRLEVARALGTAPPAGSPEDDVLDHHVARIQALLGTGFTVLPQVVPATDDALAAALADGPGRFGGDRGASSAWLHRVADVRRGVERLQTVMLYAAGGPGSLGVAQLPFDAGERWVTLPAATGAGVPGGRTSIVLHAPGAFVVPSRFTGLFVDEWVEVVPNAKEVTGLACNIDEPAAQPPQAVLVAVAPPQSKRWGLDLLESILLETLDLARLRAVSPEQLASFTDLEQVLPVLYFGLNLRDDTVSTDFTRAMEV